MMLKSLRPHRFVEQLVGLSVSGQEISVRIASFAALPSPSPASLPEPVTADVASEEAGKDA